MLNPDPSAAAAPMASRKAAGIVFGIVRMALWLAIPAYLLFIAMQTTFLQGVYIATIRDMYFGCMQSVDTKYLYRMASGSCRLKNLEYDVTMTHDQAGFRNRAGLPAAAPIVVLGDSHAYGHGVNDDQTFAALLGSQLGEPVRNLALPATATRRELETYVAQAPAANLIVLQYCDNDFDENLPSLTLSEAVYQRTLRDRMRAVIANYDYSKHQGALGQTMLTLGYAARELIGARLFRLTSSAPDETTLSREADAFARVLDQYRPWLAGKTVVVLESSGWGRNRKHFQTVFARRLQAIGQVHWVVLDSSALLARSDYFWLDDHLNASGHRKLAARLAQVLQPQLTRVSIARSAGQPPAPRSGLE